MAKYTGDALDTALPTLSAETDLDALVAKIDDDTSCVVVQYPDILGRIADLKPLADAAHAKKALLIAVVTEPVALGAIRSPGEMDADIVVGEGQSIGVGLQFEQLRQRAPFPSRRHRRRIGGARRSVAPAARSGPASLAWQTGGYAQGKPRCDPRALARGE